MGQFLVPYFILSIPLHLSLRSVISGRAIPLRLYDDSQLNKVSASNDSAAAPIGAYHYGWPLCGHGCW